EPATHVHEYDGRGAIARTGRLTPTVVLPRTGAWPVVAVAGPQRGCFLIEAPEPPTAFAAVPSIPAATVLGAAEPSAGPPARRPPSFAKPRGPDVYERGERVGGTAGRTCVFVAEISDARSGEWVMRPGRHYVAD